MKKTFTYKDKEYAVLQPTANMKKEAQLHYNKVLSEALQSGALFRKTLKDHMIKQGLWSKEKEEQNQALLEELRDLQLKLKKGGIKVSDGAKMAFRIMDIRNEINELLADQLELDFNTAEGQAETSKFSYFVYLCLVYNDNMERVFKDYNTFSSSADIELAGKATEILASLMRNINDDVNDKLPEIEFLKKFKMMDDKNRLVNKDNHLVDREGRLINEDGRFVDNEGNFVDINGNKVDKDGEWLVDEAPFLDDNGNPIVL